MLCVGSGGVCTGSGGVVCEFWQCCVWVLVACALVLVVLCVSSGNVVCALVLVVCALVLVVLCVSSAMLYVNSGSVVCGLLTLPVSTCIGGPGRSTHDPPDVAGDAGRP